MQRGLQLLLCKLSVVRSRWGCWGATSHSGLGWCMLFLPLCLTFLSWGVQSDAANEGFVCVTRVLLGYRGAGLRT